MLQEELRAELSSALNLMQQTVSLTENTLFKRLYYRGKKSISPQMVLYYMPNRLNINRLGITVSTKIGHAVVRNRMRRLVREAYRSEEQQCKAGYDLVVVVRSGMLNSNYRKICNSMNKMLKEAGIRLADGETL